MCIVVDVFKAKGNETEEERAIGIRCICPNDCMTRAQSLSISWSLISKVRILRLIQ